MKTIAHQNIPSVKVTVLVHADCAPSDAEWDPYVESLYKDYLAGKANRILVFAGEGPPPNSVQREKLHHDYQRHQVKQKTAVVAHGLVARGVVTALSWFYPIRAFSPFQLNEAFTYLDIPKKDWHYVRKVVATLRMRLFDTTADPLELGEAIGTLDELVTDRLPRLRDRMRRSRGE